jgi:hypothetical protein
LIIVAEPSNYEEYPITPAVIVIQEKRIKEIDEIDEIIVGIV